MQVVMSCFVSSADLSTAPVQILIPSSGRRTGALLLELPGVASTCGHMAFAPHLTLSPFNFPPQDSDQAFVLSSALVGWMLFVHYSAIWRLGKTASSSALVASSCPDLLCSSLLGDLCEIPPLVSHPVAACTFFLLAVLPATELVAL
jgi:hypothetical protein